MQGKYAESEPLYQRAFLIWEQTLGAQHPYTMTCLYNLLEVYESQGRYEKASQLYQQALETCRLAMPPDNPHMKALRQRYSDLLDKIRLLPDLAVTDEGKEQEKSS